MDKLKNIAKEFGTEALTKLGTTALTNGPQSTLAPQAQLPPPLPYISNDEKKKAILEEYCQIVRKNEPAITKLFQESMEKYFYNFQESIENKKKIQEYMFNKIFDIVEKSITADNLSIKFFIAAIIKKGSIDYILQDIINSELGSPEAAFDHLIKKLRETTEPTKQEGGDADNEKVIEIIDLFTKNEDGNAANNKILDIISLAFERELDKPENKLFIYEIITKNIETKIGEAISQFSNDWFDDKNVVKPILYNILTNKNLFDSNENINSKIRGAFKEFIEKDATEDRSVDTLKSLIVLYLTGEKSITQKYGAFGGGRRNKSRKVKKRQTKSRKSKTRLRYLRKNATQ
jgi:hypothetical protein